MKIRKGFVTNSSSSSFVVAMKALSEKQKAAILDVVLDEFFGKKVNLTGNESEEEMSAYHISKYDFPAVKECMEKGYDIYTGSIDFETFSGNLKSDIMKKIWKKMEDIDKDRFVGIDTDLYY